MITITSKNIVKETLLKLKDELELERKLAIEKRLNFYYGNYKNYIDDELKEQFVEQNYNRIKLMIDDSMNIVKRIVDETSQVYKVEANRKTDPEDENYKKLLSKIPFDLKMEKVNKLTNVDNETVIKISPRDNTIKLDILTPNRVEVIQREDDPTEPLAVIYDQAYVDTRGESKVYHIYWDIYGHHYKFDEDLNPVKREGNPNNENPYADPDNTKQTILPFVICHKNFPDNSVWEPIDGGDLFSATKQIAVLLTYINYLFKVQSFKQPYVSGTEVNTPPEVILDPLTILQISGEGAHMGTLDLNTNIDSLYSIVEKKIGYIANQHGISLEQFKLTGSPASGLSLKISNRALLETRESQIKHYRIYENELHRKIVIVNNYHYSDRKIKEDSKFSIDYGEIKFEKSDAEKNKDWEIKIKNDVKNVLDWVMEQNPDIKDYDEAEKVLLKNRELNKKFKVNIAEIRNAMEKQLIGESNETIRKVNANKKE